MGTLVKVADRKESRMLSDSSRVPQSGSAPFLLGSLVALFLWAQAATYMMSLVRWATTPHGDIWHGVGSLVWALCPVANYAYVSDWWSAAISWVF